QAEDGIRDFHVTGVQTCALPIFALLKYGCGVPFNRLEKLQHNLGIPLPAATQWEVVDAAADLITPAHEELIRQAAQGEVVHNDRSEERRVGKEWRARRST